MMYALGIGAGVRHLLPALVLVCALTGCARRDAPFLEANARTHLNRLAGAIGSRWIGTPANGQAREYLIEQLQLFGFDVRVQQVEAERPEIGRTARVANIIATKRGSLPIDEGAVAIVAHYDSRSDSPGATDDGLGAAACVESARVLAALPMRHTLLVLLTDGEEPGLMGAAGIVTDPALRPVRALINLDSIGSAEPSLLFQATPGSDWLLRSWARRAPRPRGGSYAIEIYKRLPNDTDFTIFQAAGLSALNFAAVGDGFSYHTARDVPERVTSRVLRQTGENIVGVVQALDEMDLPAPQTPATTLRSAEEAERTRETTAASTYFSILERSALIYPSALRRLVAVAAVLMGLVACFRLWRSTPQMSGGLVAWTTVWSLLGVGGVGVAMLGVTSALRAAREVYHPWYAQPGRLMWLLVATAAATVWLIRRAAIILPRGIRGGTHPSLVWIVTLPVWMGLTALVEWKATSAAYLWSVPLLSSSALLSVSGGRWTSLLRLVSILVFGLSAVLWIPDGLVIFSFAVAALGREPIVTPTFVYPALLLLLGHVTVPPLLAVISGRERQLWQPGLTTGLWLLLLTITAALAYVAPAYTYERSLRRQVRYINDGISRQAFWEIGSNEPGLDVDADKGAPREWQTAGTSPATSLPLRPLSGPFVFRTSALADSPSPGSVRTTITPGDRGLQVEITVVPTEPGLTASFAMPRRLVPSEPNLVGTVRNGRWTATYVAPPLDGVTFRATFVGATPETFRDAIVLLQSTGLPDGRGWQRLPPWLPQERTVWNASSYWLLPVLPGP
ncbi:MAG: M28 family peptidase [Acidobacteria bacterium]|nr:M28 family peptidase [Acidobacteriota bacterium]